MFSFYLYFQDDGLMIVCDVCKYWQHAVCFCILEEEHAPEDHVCDACIKVSRLKLQTQHKPESMIRPTLFDTVTKNIKQNVSTFYETFLFFNDDNNIMKYILAWFTCLIFFKHFFFGC